MRQSKRIFARLMYAGFSSSPTTCRSLRNERENCAPPEDWAYALPRGGYSAMKRQRLLHGSLLGCLLIAFAAPGVAQVTGSFTTITSPAAGTGALQGTYVLGIDTAGD